MIRVRVEDITSNSGETIALPESGVICIVGGNNAGKSQLLREIEKQLNEHGENVPIVLQHVSVDKPELGIEEAEAFLPLFPKQQSDPGTTAQYHSLSSPVVHSAEEFVRMFNLFGDSVFSVGAFFMQRFAAGDMKNIATGHATFAPEQSNRLTSVYYDSDIEQTISHLSVNTFGVPLFFNRLRGDERFRVGQVDYPAPTFGQVTREYVQAVNELPLLAD